MLEDLDKLASQIETLASVIQQLRDENQSLKNDLAKTQLKNTEYKASLVKTRERVEHLIASLPGSDAGT